MFYLKYRPQTLAEIDNANVGERILQMLKSGQVPHAFLFVGPKGTGKTSSARILARALNCEKNFFADSSIENVEPCNKCASCLAILSEKSPDVVEIDGASSRKIEDVREIIEAVRYTPLVQRRKIYIIDEVHMFTREAFNALLKTIEEPPTHVTFILATTEKEKVPATILSRTTLIQVPQASEGDLHKMLERICKSENLEVEKEVLALIIRLADKSFRIAAKYLEELKIAGALTDLAKAQKLLFGSEEIDILSQIVSADSKATLALLHHFYESGGSVKTLIEIMTAQVYEHLLFLQGLRTEKVKEIDSLDQKSTLLLLKYLQKAYEHTKGAVISVLPLQLCMVEYFHENSQK